MSKRSKISTLALGLRTERNRWLLWRVARIHNQSRIVEMQIWYEFLDMKLCHALWVVMRFFEQQLEALMNTYL